jgi:hypothetical protein
MKKPTPKAPVLDMEEIRKALGADEVVRLKGKTAAERAVEALEIYRKRQEKLRKEKTK